jgi:filamentous hemagglutinin
LLRCCNADLYNRQLHPNEEKKLEELQKGKTAEEQYRLAAAECALVHCADNVPDSDPNRAVLQKMQTDGQGYTKEQNLLKQAGAFDGYGRLEALNDGLDRYQVSNRAVGAVQGVMGSVAAGVVLGGSCATVVACLAGAAVAGTSLDYSKAGFTQLLNGDVSLTYGEQALQSLGLSPQVAAIAYAGLSIGGAAAGAALENQAGKQAAGFNDAARLTYTNEKFGAQGLQPTAEVMKTPQAQAIVDAYVAAGLPLDKAMNYAGGLIETGTSLPIKFAVNSDTELIKVVPKGINGSDSINGTSPYFMTRAQYDSLSTLPPDQIAAKLGLPAEQGVRGALLGFDVYAMTPKPGTTPAAFTSQVAPVQQGGYSASGGAQQVLVTNRSQWTDPNANKIGEIKGLR